MPLPNYVTEDGRSFPRFTRRTAITHRGLVDIDALEPTDRPPAQAEIEAAKRYLWGGRALRHTKRGDSGFLIAKWATLDQRTLIHAGGIAVAALELGIKVRRVPRRSTFELAWKREDTRTG